MQVLAMMITQDGCGAMPSVSTAGNLACTAAPPNVISIACPALLGVCFVRQHASITAPTGLATRDTVMVAQERNYINAESCQLPRENHNSQQKSRDAHPTRDV